MEAVIGPASRGRWAVWSDLFKARLTLLVLMTTAVGFSLGSSSGVDWTAFVHTLAGTLLLAAGASALNQYWERETDARMERTRRRPIPAGEITPGLALATGVATSIGGLLYLLAWVNPLTAFLGMLTLGSYVFVYTPLKRVTTLNTLVGAVPGALPPLMGWTGATGQLAPGGWALFTILYFWQLPHFMAIAWLYREDYARGGYRMLAVVDPDGRRTASTAVRHTLALVAFSLWPFSLGLVHPAYLVGALVLGAAFFAAGVGFAREISPARARRLFFASILYLPLLLGCLVATRTKALTTAEESRQRGAAIFPTALTIAAAGPLALDKQETAP